MIAAVVEHGDPVRDAEHHRHVVLGEEQGEAARVRDLVDEPDRLLRLARRHARGRLVEEQHPRPLGEGDGELELLLLAVGELPRLFLRLLREPDEGEEIQRLAAVEARPDPEHREVPVVAGHQGHLHVLEHAHARIHVDPLEGAREPRLDDAVRRQPGQLAPLVLDPAPVRPEVPGDEVEEGRLARPVRADDRVLLALLELEVHPVDGDEPPEVLEEVDGAQHRPGPFRQSSPRARRDASLRARPARPSGRKSRMATRMRPSTIGQYSVYSLVRRSSTKRVAAPMAGPKNE